MAKLDFVLDKKVGKLKIMHSVNNVPIGDPVRKADNMSTIKYFEAAHIPYCRSHDAAFSEHYGGPYAVDVHRIFRDFSKNVDDENTYDFEYTDKYVQAARAVGAEVFYRLGASIEHYKKVGTYPPSNYLKWAKICEHIIRHYNEGWDNGFEYNIKYWEIWNEPHCKNPDGSNPCWQGTMEEFYDFFVVVFRHLKTCFPNLKIGGPSLCHCYDREFNKNFFTRLQKENLTLDFFSFHEYSYNPRKFYDDGEFAYNVLKEYGCEKQTSLILNEWNYVRRWTGDEFINSIHTIHNLKGASFIAGTMIVTQSSKIEQLMYYDGKPGTWCGMFDPIFHTPEKGYYPFLIYGDMYTNMNSQVYSNSDDNTVYALASKGRKSYGLFITYFDDDDNCKAKDIEINISNMKKEVEKTIEYYVVDKNNDYSLVKTEKTSCEKLTTTLHTEPYTIYYIKIRY